MAMGALALAACVHACNQERAASVGSLLGLGDSSITFPWAENGCRRPVSQWQCVAVHHNLQTLA
jgi:hypothetical protein